MRCQKEFKTWHALRLLTLCHQHAWRPSSGNETSSVVRVQYKPGFRGRAQKNVGYLKNNLNWLHAETIIYDTGLTKTWKWISPALLYLLNVFHMIQSCIWWPALSLPRHDYLLSPVHAPTSHLWSLLIVTGRFLVTRSPATALQRCVQVPLTWLLMAQSCSHNVHDSILLWQFCFIIGYYSSLTVPNLHINLCQRCVCTEKSMVFGTVDGLRHPRGSWNIHPGDERGPVYIVVHIKNIKAQRPWTHAICFYVFRCF